MVSPADSGNPANPAELLAIAIDAALAAGRLLAARDGRDGSVSVAATKSSPTDVVTEMDRRA